MKRTLFDPLRLCGLLAFLSIGQQALAFDAPVILQLKYAPWGGIDADEDKVEHNPAPYGDYDMTFDRSFSGRIIVEPFYISAQHSTATLHDGLFDAEVDTVSIGFAGIAYDKIEAQHHTYLIGGLGVGKGRFRFNAPALNEEEWLFEANAEGGFRLQKHLLFGVGVDFQHFGEFHESKASSWTLYITTGVLF